jgi:hypothetical protein
VRVAGAIASAALACAGCDFNGDYIKYCQRTGLCDGGVQGDGGPGSGDGGSLGLGFTPSNVNPTGIDLSKLGDVDITQSGCHIDTGSASLDCDDVTKTAFVTITQSNQIQVGVYVARSWRIEPNATLAVTGSFPLALIATDQINVLGAFSAAATAGDTSGGGFTSPMNANTQGTGPGGGGAGTSATAAGGGSYCGTGGSGATENGSTPASGGSPYGAPTNIPLEGGSSGGSGAEAATGAGGGAIELVAKNSISILAGGSIDVGGGGGNFGGTSGQEASAGGSGGAILLEAPSVTVAGVLAANGGGGGQGAGGNSGSDATANNQPATGGNDSTRGSFGGNGSAGTTIGGAPGNDTAGSSAGAGGGGAGRIRINTADGDAGLQGVLSPAASTPCVTVGRLSP